MAASTVLVVSGGGFQGVAMLKALHALGHLRLLLADCHEENLGRYMAHGFFKAPLLGERETFVAFLLELCVQERVEAIFPATSFELELLAQERPRLQQMGIQVWVSELPVLEMARDKAAFYSWARAQGLPVLPTFDTALDPAATYPLLGKPKDGWGGTGFLRMQSREQALAQDSARQSLHVWQPMLADFEEFSIDFAIDAEGQASTLHARQRLRTAGGFAVLCKPAQPAGVLAVADAAVAALAAKGARGVLNLQLLVHQAQCWVSDFNPRIGTSMPLTLVAGSNPVAFLLPSSRVHAGPLCRAAESSEQAAPAPAATPASAPKLASAATGSDILRPGVRSFRVLQERLVPALHLSNVAGVVFDLDDTLLDQKDWVWRKMQGLWEALRDTMEQSVDRAGFLQCALHVLEEGERAQLLDRIFERLSLPSDLLPQAVDAYRQVLPGACHVYPDVAGSLLQLRRSGYRIGLLSDNPAASQRQKLQASGLASQLDAVVLTGDLACSKPDRRTFDAIAQALDLPAQALVMVGDNPFRDCAGALAAGFRHSFQIQRAGGFFNFSADLCAEVLPMAQVTTLRDLSEIHWYLPRPSASAGCSLQGSPTRQLSPMTK